MLFFSFLVFASLSKDRRKLIDVFTAVTSVPGILPPGCRKGLLLSTQNICDSTGSSKMSLGFSSC